MPGSATQAMPATSTSSTLQDQAGTKAAKLAQAANTGKVTEYFPIRRSEEEAQARMVLKEQMDGRY